MKRIGNALLPTWNDGELSMREICAEIVDYTLIDDVHAYEM